MKLFIALIITSVILTVSATPAYAGRGGGSQNGGGSAGGGR